MQLSNFGRFGQKYLHVKKMIIYRSKTGVDKYRKWFILVTMNFMTCDNLYHMTKWSWKVFVVKIRSFLELFSPLPFELTLFALWCFSWPGDFLKGPEDWHWQKHFYAWNLHKNGFWKLPNFFMFLYGPLRAYQNVQFLAHGDRMT